MNRQALIDNPEWNPGSVCVVCGCPNIQKHHVFGGTANRRICDQYKYIIPLCYNDHIGANGIHRNRGLDLYWKETAQEHFETHKGTRQEFIKLFGKSWR